MKMSRFVGCIVAATIVLQATSGWATIAYDSTGPVSNQSFDGTVGLDFDVLDPAGIRVTALGGWDQNGDGVLATGVNYHVAIFNRTVDAADPNDTIPGTIVPGLDLQYDSTTAGARFESDNALFDIPSVVLPQGEYVMVYDGNAPLNNLYNVSGDPNNPNVFLGDTNDGGGLIAFVGTGRFGFPGFGYPHVPQLGDLFPEEYRYQSGTFEFEAVPEPGALALVGLALVGVAAGRRRS